MRVRAGIFLLFFALILAACRFQLPTTIDSIPFAPIPAVEQAAPAITAETAGRAAAAATSQPTTTPTRPAPAAPTATPIRPLDPEADGIVARAMAKMAEAGTFHYAMDRQLAHDPAAPDLLLHIPVSARYHAPDRLQGSISFSSAAEEAAFDFIIIGDDLYLREPPDGQWQQMRDGEAAAQMIRENALLPLTHLSADKLHDSEMIADVLLAGVAVHHVRSKMGRKAAEGDLSAGAGSVDLWIGKADHYVHRAILRTTATTELGLIDSGSSTAEVDYSGFGTPVMIVAPLIPEASGFRPIDAYPIPGAILEEDSPNQTDGSISVD